MRFFPFMGLDTEKLRFGTEKAVDFALPPEAYTMLHTETINFGLDVRQDVGNGRVYLYTGIRRDD